MNKNDVIIDQSEITSTTVLYKHIYYVQLIKIDK